MHLKAQINLLDLESSLILTPKTAEAATRRFLHIPGTTGLTELPSSITTAVKSPLRSLFAKSVLQDLRQSANRDIGAKDESFDSLLNRRFGPEMARMMGSSVVHGIYAADSRTLSVRAAFPKLWDCEKLGGGSIINGMIRGRGKKTVNESEDYDIGDLGAVMLGVSVFSFKDGLTTLTRSLRDKLGKLSNVSFWTSSDVVALYPRQSRNEIEVSSLLHPHFETVS